MLTSSLLSGKGGSVFTITPQTSIRELIGSLASHSVGALVVSSDGSTIDGIVSERDVVRALALDGQDLLERPVAQIMTTSVYTTTPDAPVDELMRLMTERRIRHVPVVDDDQRLIGIISIGDVVKSRLGELEGERAALVDYITRGG